MALQHLRSGTANKRPIPTVMSAGQIAINTNEASPGLFFKDSNGDLVKVGPVHIGTSAPNSSPDSVAATALVTGTVYQILTVGTSDFTLVGASANTVGVIFTATGTATGDGTVSGHQGVEKGEMWLDTTGGSYVLKIYDGTDWRSEAGEFVNTSGDTITGDLVFNNANIVFEGATADNFETTLTVVDPTADRTLSLPNVTGTLISTGDTATVTSAMIDDGAGSGLDADKLDGQHGSSFLRSNANDSASGNLTFNNGISTAGEDVYLGNGTLIASDDAGAFANRTGSNIDHIWHDEANNAWNFCSDTTYKAAGNSELQAGSLDVSGAVTVGGELNMLGSADADKYLDARIGANTFHIRKTTGGDAGHESLFEADGDGGCRLYFNNATKLETTTSGATVTGTCAATAFSGSGASLTSLNASNISSGTVNTARLPNTYTKAATVTIQATGAANDVKIDAADHIILEAGEEEDGQIYFRANSGGDSYRFAKSGQTAIEGFLSFESLTADRTFTFPNTAGTIALTTSDISGDITGSIAGASDYGTLLRSNAADTASGKLTFTAAGTDTLTLNKNSATSYSGITFAEGGDDRFLFYVTNQADGTLNLQARKNGTNIRSVWSVNQSTGVQNFIIAPTIEGNEVWHAGNDGAGSGLDADRLDGQQGSYYLNTATTFGGDVSGTYNAIVIANDSHTHSFANLTNKGSGTGDYSTTGIIEAGRGGGGVALTSNDGYGNANVTFNHASGTPEQTGKAARIEVNTDSTSGEAVMTFELGNATANTPAALTQVLKLETGTSEFTSSAGLEFNNRPAFNGGTSGSSSPFTVDSNQVVTNLNADLLDGIQASDFLRSSQNGTMTGRLTIDRDNDSSGALRIEANQTNPNADFYFAQEIVSTLSGSGTTSGDREQGGIWIDVNSSATGGNTSNEHRAYGLYVDLDSTGDSDLVCAVYADATATPTTGTTTEVVGVYGRAEDNGGAGNVTNVYAVRGLANSDNSNSDINGMFGGYFKSQTASDTGNIGNAYGIYAEIEIPSGTGDHLGDSYVVRAMYDNNDTVAQTNTTYLFHGNYTGTNPTNAYGVYIAAPCDNYFAGNVGIGTTSPGAGLEISGTGQTRQIIRSTDNQSVQIRCINNTNSDVYFGSAGADFRVLTSAQERARIDSSGRLLVGTSSSSTQGKVVIVGNSSSSTGEGELHLARGATPTSQQDLGTIHFGGLGLEKAAQIICSRDGGTWASGSSHPSRLKFSTTADGSSSSTERMRITGNGTIYFHNYVGTNPSTTSFGIAFNRSTTSSTNPGRVECYRNVNGTVIAQQFGGNAGQVYIKGDGDLENTNNSYAGISDVKLKENIINASSQWDDLKALQVRKYNFKAETGYNTHTQIGLIAQEVELVSPGLVGESIDEETGESTKSVNYSVLYMKAVKALQEAMERIEQLESSNADLLARVTALEGN